MLNREQIERLRGHAAYLRIELAKGNHPDVLNFNERNHNIAEAIDAALAVIDKLSQAILDIAQEDDNNSERWGDEHDDSHTADEWAGFILEYAERAKYDTPMDYRQTMVKIGAVATAAIRAFDREAALAATKEKNTHD